MELNMIQQTVQVVAESSFWEQVAVGVTVGVILTIVGLVVKHVRQNKRK